MFEERDGHAVGWGNHGVPAAKFLRYRFRTLLLLFGCVKAQFLRHVGTANPNGVYCLLAEIQPLRPTGIGTVEVLVDTTYTQTYAEGTMSCSILTLPLFKCPLRYLAL